jgi:hypothetical protein
MMDALTSAAGEERVSVRISPQNNIDDSDSQWLVNHRDWPEEGSPTCNVIEGYTSGKTVADV